MSEFKRRALTLLDVVCSSVGKEATHEASVRIDNYLSVCNRRSEKAPRLSLLRRIGKRGRRCHGVVDVVVARR